MSATGSSRKTKAQQLLKRLGIYDRLKASVVYDFYWTIADSRVIDRRRTEIEFYQAHLQGFKPGDLFFDIGANEGYKTDVFLRMGARVVAIDPDVHNQKLLEKRFLSYRIRRRPVVLVDAAVSDQDGVATMWLDAPGSAKNTLAKKWVDVLRNDKERFGERLTFGSQQQVKTICLETLIARYGAPFFIKIDVEGHEPSILRGLRQPVPYLSFEVNLPEFKPEGEECIKLLGKLTPRGKFNYAVDCQSGLVFDDWVATPKFLSAFNQCAAKSIEVFWNAVQ